ncbi:purine-nucleoside phosphorylase, partial [Streptomyces rubiginosohelvolus]
MRVNASVSWDNQGDPHAAADAAATRLRELTGAETHDVALVLGSGWVPATDALGAPEHEFPVTELPGFPPPAVAGHAGRIRSYRLNDKRALVFLGRTHYYEGRGVAAVAHGVRTAVAAGCKTIILTNG